MKTLVKQFQQYLLKKGLTLDITGKEYMNINNISVDDLVNWSKKVLNNDDSMLYDNITIITNEKNVKKIEEVFKFDDSYWFTIDEFRKSKKITRLLFGDVFKEGNLKGFTISLLEYIEKLKNIANDDNIELNIKILSDDSLKIKFCNNEIIDVSNLILDNASLNDDSIKTLLYQLIVLSYDYSFKDTLSVLNLL